jgi:hypothetical protein
MAGMRTKTIAVILGLFLAAGMCYAADPFMGTWKLNEKKSKLAPGNGKNDTVTYGNTMMGKVKVTVDGVGADGKPAHNTWTGKFDGKDYSVTGDPTSDTRAYTKVNDRTLEMTVKKDGKVTGTGRVAVSADGKSRTVTLNGTNAKGKKFKSTAVYDKE